MHYFTNLADSRALSCFPPNNDVMLFLLPSLAQHEHSLQLCQFFSDFPTGITYETK